MLLFISYFQRGYLLLKFILGSKTYYGLHSFLVLEKDQCGDATHTKTLGKFLLIININFNYTFSKDYISALIHQVPCQLC